VNGRANYFLEIRYSEFEKLQGDRGKSLGKFGLAKINTAGSKRLPMGSRGVQGFAY
jgi:hypothetical protein